MLDFTIYTANCTGDSSNCLYPNKVVVTDKDSFIAATKMDHVTAKYKGDYRSKDNFEFADCIPLDCDNDHSDDPKDWVAPFDIALEIPDVAFAASYSRHNMLVNSHIDLVKRKANYEYVCDFCKKPFTAYGNAKRKYCCFECYSNSRIKSHNFNK